MPVRNGGRTIEASLDAVVVAADLWGPTSIVVVDNGSSDGTAEIVGRRYSARITILSEPDGTVGAVRNRGAATHRHADLLSFVDADCVISPGHFFIAWNALQRTGAAAVGFPYRLPPDPQWIERTWDRLHLPPGPGFVSWLFAGNMVIRRVAFAEIGGFKESLPTGEDPELGLRLRAAGHTLYNEPALATTHLGNPRSIRAFLRQQWWHGLGMLRDGTPPWKNLPLLMAAMLGTATISAGLFVLLTAEFHAALLAVMASQALVPLATVWYRQQQTHRWGNPLPGMVLYWLYYWARIAALGSILLGMPRPPRGRN